jgi:hypothetical protein
MMKLGTRLGGVTLALVLLVVLTALGADAATRDTRAAPAGGVQVVAVGTATAQPDPAGGVTALTSPAGDPAASPLVGSGAVLLLPLGAALLLGGLAMSRRMARQC